MISFGSELVENARIANCCGSVAHSRDRGRQNILDNYNPGCLIFFNPPAVCYENWVASDINMYPTTPITFHRIETRNGPLMFALREDIQVGA